MGWVRFCHGFQSHCVMSRAAPTSEVAHPHYHRWPSVSANFLYAKLILQTFLDMTWENTIREQFDLVDCFTTDETEYYGPYNTLLTDIFPHSEHFQIVPQYKGPITPGSIDFTTIYIVRKRKCPVFFIEIKPFPHPDDISTREKADQQMRDRFVTIIGRNLVIPKLYGISAMGTRFSVYEYKKETNILLPPTIARDTMYVTDVAPAERWNYELLEDVGEQKMRELVAEVKVMCEGINACAYIRLCWPHSMITWRKGK
jgi:hypothetical protein